MRRLLNRIWSRREYSHRHTSNPDAGRCPNLFPEHPPPSPHEILSDLNRHRKETKEVRYAAAPDDFDTPSKTLYRLYENIMLDDNLGIRNELEYFWQRHTWKLSEIPDPLDEDPARYAVLACSTNLMEMAYNNLIKLGAVRDGRSVHTMEEFEKMRKQRKCWETVPLWAQRVEPLAETLVIPTHDDVLLQSFDDERACLPFKKKNILIWQPHIYFI